MKLTMMKLTCILMTMAFLASASYSFGEESPDKLDNPSDTSVARIIDCHGPVEILGQDTPPAAMGMKLHAEDTVVVAEEGYCALVFRDGTVKTYDGPRTIYFNAPKRGDAEGILGKVTRSIAELFFVSDDSSEDTQLGTRESFLDDPVDRIPRLIFPPDGTRLLESPPYLKWRLVEGVSDYSVSLYEGSNRLLSVNTTDTSLKIDPQQYVMTPGSRFVWRVKAVVGDSCLRSRTSEFAIAGDAMRSRIKESITAIDAQINDIRLSKLMKAQLYRDLGLNLNCYWELESVLENHPDDEILLRAKADVLCEMGHIEEALATYRKILN